MIETLKKIAANEGGEIRDESQTLSEIGLDSFGYAIFWFEVASAFEVDFKTEWVMSLDYTKFTVRDLMAKIRKLKEADGC